MEHYYALKAAMKHGFDSHHFPMVPIAIEFGRCVLERPRCLSFFYFDEHVFDKWFHVALKANNAGTEIWLSSFHRTKPHEVGRITRKGTIIRPEKW